MKQTAVEFLVNSLNNYDSKMIELFNKEIEQAIELEKKQIIYAHLNGQAEFDTQEFRKEIVDCAEQYYNETFKNKVK